MDDEHKSIEDYCREMDQEYYGMTEEDYEVQKDFEEYCREIEDLNPGCTGGA